MPHTAAWCSVFHGTLHRRIHPAITVAKWGCVGTCVRPVRGVDWSTEIVTRSVACGSSNRVVIEVYETGIIAKLVRVEHSVHVSYAVHLAVGFPQPWLEPLPISHLIACAFVAFVRWRLVRHHYLHNFSSFTTSFFGRLTPKIIAQSKAITDTVHPAIGRLQNAVQRGVR